MRSPLLAEPLPDHNIRQDRKSAIMKSRTRLILLHLLLLGIFSCQDPGDDFGSGRRKAVEQFVQYLKENNEQGVYQVTYHGDLPDNITNEELRRRDVQKASEIIRRYGLPAERLWEFRVDTSNPATPYSVLIPLLRKSNTEQAHIYIAFPPAGVSEKISRYTITAPEASPIGRRRPV
jgi:hypothetical protein